MCQCANFTVVELDEAIAAIYQRFPGQGIPLDALVVLALQDAKIASKVTTNNFEVTRKAIKKHIKKGSGKLQILVYQV